MGQLNSNDAGISSAPFLRSTHILTHNTMILDTIICDIKKYALDILGKNAYYLVITYVEVPMYKSDMSFSPDLISKMVRCIEDAVGDDILADVHRNELYTTNSVPSRIWDLLNTGLFKALEAEACTVATAHRGPWEMLVIYERTSRCVLTFMREKRFAELQRKQRSRVHMHYVDMLAKQFNGDLLADQQQLTLIPHEFSDENRLPELVQNLLRDLGGEADIVRHHVLVLFDTAGYQLTRVRAVMVTPTLDVAKGCEQDWSQYIAAAESVVVEKVVAPEAPANQPHRGLTLKPKAVARQKSRPKQKKTERKICEDG